MKKLIITSLLLFNVFIVAEEIELYQDEKTGQVFSTPAEGRVKLKVFATKPDVKSEVEVKADEDAKALAKEKFEADAKAKLEAQSKVDERKLRINGRVQVRSVAGQEDTVFSNGHSNYNAWDVNFRRLRFGFNYEGAKWWGATVDIKLENLLNQNYTTTKTFSVVGADGKKYTALREVKLNDSRGGIQEANLWAKAPIMDSKIYFGSQRLRFLREDLATSANILTPERAFSVSFLPQWDIGTFLDIHPLKLIDKKYTYFLKMSGAVTAGKGTHEGYGRQRVLTENRSNTSPLLISPMLSWRIEVNPFDGIVNNGKTGDWKEGEEIFQRNLKVSLGMSGVTSKELKYVDTYDTNTRGVSKVNVLMEQTTASGGNINSNGIIVYDITPGATNYNRQTFGLNAHTYDFTATWKGIYASGASTFFTGSAAGGDTRTHQLTLGYNIPISKYYLMPLVRYDFLKGDFDRNKTIDDYEIFKGYWVGLNFFGGDSHDFKVQLFLNILRDRSKPRYFIGDIFPKDLHDANNNLLYFQVQVSFGEVVALK